MATKSEKKPAAKKVAPAKPAKKAAAPAKAVKKAAPAKPAKKAAPVKAVKKAAPAKPAKKAAAPAKAVKKAAPAKPAKKAAPVKAVKKAAPVKPVKKVATKVAPAAKKAATKAPAKAPAKDVKIEPPVVVKKETAVERKRREKEEAAAEARLHPVVQVITPIGGAFVPSVRKAVPGKKAAPKHRVIVEDPSSWSKKELNDARKMLQREIDDHEKDIAAAEARFHTLIVDSGEGAGDDQADAGTKTFEREQEIALIANTRDLLDQARHAIERIDAGAYGTCESCGKSIGKERQLNKPRATLCVTCLEKQDRF